MRARVAGLVLVVALGVTVGGCDGSGGGEASRDAQLYVATIRDVLAEQPPAVDAEVLPVVYVVGVGETKIPADVQAEVAVELDEDADIRFADKREEAMLERQEHAPVRDDGVLVAIGELPVDASTMLVDVEIYRSDQDSSKVVLTLVRGSSQWTVTSTSVLSASDS